ncbi:uncharacterized protein [Primulina eburnea]|uniref:uncharacterized protein isoform X1 n=2 Tax=Primulina eburnea TaxID=1245227 RepID=UPI003C6CB5CF
MASEGKTVGKLHFQHQDKANTQSRIMIANHAARSSKKVGLARELGSMNDSGKEVQNIQGMLNNQMDGVSKHQHNDLQGMTRKSKFFGKSHFQLRDEEDTQPRIISANHVTRNSKKRVNTCAEFENMQGMLNNQKDKVSKQQHNDVQGMAFKNKNVGKTHFQLQDETNTQPLILIDNHTTRNSKERDCQSVQDPSRNQIDEASNQNDIELQGSTSRITFNNNPHVENDFMDEESDQDVDSESESLDAEKKTRGPTFMKEIWGRPSTLPRIKIQCDDMGRPIGSRRNKFTDFLGTLARNGKFCPIDVEDWHKMPLDSKKKMLDVIKEKYDLPPGTESWTLRSIGTKWRNWKSELKKKYYDPELPMQVLLEERDKRAFVEQYVKLVAQWNSEKSKERSEKNKIARNQKIMNQTTGRRYFAQVQQKLKKEKGRPPSRVELFMLVSLMLMEVPQATLWQKNWLQ